mgnify:CR=1 FL=1
MESYLDNRTKEAKQSSPADACSLPEINASGKENSSDSSEAGRPHPEKEKNRQMPRFDPNALQEVPIALEDVPEGKRPKVQLVMEDDKVSRVIVTCSCGECVELECNY